MTRPQIRVVDDSIVVSMLLSKLITTNLEIEVVTAQNGEAAIEQIHKRSDALAIILTGMGQDGLSGCKEIKASGGWVLAQDAATSGVWGMPGEVANAGFADEILPLESFAKRIRELLI